MRIDERIVRYLAKCPVPQGGSDGRRAVFRAACALVNGFNLPADEALPFLTTHTATCQPLWSTEALKEKVAEAMRAQHTQPAGYLLDRNGSSLEGKRAGREPSPVPLRPRNSSRQPEKKHFGTLGTVFLQLRADAHTRTHAGTHTCACTDVALEPSQASREAPADAQDAEAVEDGPSQASQRDPLPGKAADGAPSVECPPLAPVAGCSIGRPPEIDVSDDTWRAVVASGFAEEPAVQYVLWAFGPGCRVVSTLLPCFHTSEASGGVEQISDFAAESP